MVEVWKQIEGFEGRYSISNLGNVKSLKYGGRELARNLVPKVNNSGRLWVELWKDGKRHCYLIHRLVAMHFIPNEDSSKNTINHIDENPQNNIVTNLEWCTQEENNLWYRLNHGWTPNPSGKKRKYYRRSEKYVPKRKNKKHIGVKIVQFSLIGEAIAIHDDIATIHRTLGYNNTSIWECCTGKRKTAYGYKWQFANQVALT